MSTISSPDPAIAEILDYWFSMTNKEWFQGGADQDKTIIDRFAPLVEKARLTDELDATWLSTASGSLAMIILLDQFTRNIFRVGNHPEPGLSWSGDAKAQRIAVESIAKGFDKQVQQEYASSNMAGAAHRYFFYMPFMHAEDMISQIASCALFDGMKHECEVAKMQRQLEGKEETEQEKALQAWMEMAVPFAIKHRDCVAANGRFPKRNEPLRRETTEAEKRYLEEHPHGF